MSKQRLVGLVGLVGSIFMYIAIVYAGLAYVDHEQCRTQHTYAEHIAYSYTK